MANPDRAPLPRVPGLLLDPSTPFMAPPAAPEPAIDAEPAPPCAALDPMRELQDKAGAAVAALIAALDRIIDPAQVLVGYDDSSAAEILQMDRAEVRARILTPSGTGPLALIAHADAEHEHAQADREIASFHQARPHYPRLPASVLAARQDARDMLAWFQKLTLDGDWSAYLAEVETFRLALSVFETERQNRRDEAERQAILTELDASARHARLMARAKELGIQIPAAAQ